ncbi:MAG: hypothetical protein V2A58_02465 [Planctomycetota bacterium]
MKAMSSEHGRSERVEAPRRWRARYLAPASVAGRLCLRRRGGALLMLVVTATLILMGVMLSALLVFRTTREVIQNELNYHGQAVNAAKAGLVDTLAWFRRQTEQPVQVFAPERDLDASPPVNETDDPAIGLVREYQISTKEHVWGRYEVRVRVVRDITEERNLTGQGRCWYIESKGYVFERLENNYTPDGFYYMYETADGTVRRKVALGGYDYETETTEPDGALVERHDERLVRILASSRVSTELRRLSIVPPADAAVCLSRANWATLGNRCRVSGGPGYGLVYPNGTGSPSINSGAELTGTPPRGGASPSTYLLDMEDVFGVTKQELRTLSDIYTTDPSSLPAELPDYQLVYIDSDVTWTASKPLRGTAIVYVDGNVTLASNSSSYFSGVLYVEGDYTQQAPSLVLGTLMVKGHFSISGLGDYSELDFDAGVRQRLLMITGQYRFSAPFCFLQ